MTEQISLKNVIGEEFLNRIQNSYLIYVESSAAIYELNGDYAATILISRYCDFLSQASRKIAEKTDEEALKSGKWICHEDCWATSLQSIRDKKPCERECSGGIKIYAVPIIADGMVIGSNNVRVSNMPTDEKKIEEVAQRYKVDPKELLKIAKEYNPRTKYVFDAVKKHVLLASDTIAEFFLQKKAQRELKESRDEFRLIYDAITDSITVISPNYRIVRINKFVREHFGKDLIGKLCYKVYQSRNEICPDCPTKKAIETKKPAFSFQPATKVSLPVDIYAFPILNEDGEVTAVVEHGKDITKRKKAEETLQESETNLKKAQEIAKLGCWSWDRHKDIAYWSDQIFRILGYDVNEIQLSFKWLLEIMHHDDVEPVMNGIEESLKTGKSYDMEYRLTRKDGKEITVHSQAEVIFNERGEATKLMGVILDITERKEAEKQLKDSESKLRRQKLALEKKNIALREIIKQIDVEKNKLKEDISININKTLLPIILKLKNGENSKSYIELLGYHLEELLSSFGRKITDGNYNLTSRELEICNMIKGGLRSKEISNLLNISYETVEKHRRNIRKKMGISKEKVNLYYLLQRF